MQSEYGNGSSRRVERVCPGGSNRSTPCKAADQSIVLTASRPRLSERKLICWLRRVADQGSPARAIGLLEQALCQLPADAPVFVGGQRNIRLDFECLGSKILSCIGTQVLHAGIRKFQGDFFAGGFGVAPAAVTPRRRRSSASSSRPV
jgi:hypothetical protein